MTCRSDVKAPRDAYTIQEEHGTSCLEYLSTLALAQHCQQEMEAFRWPVVSTEASRCGYELFRRALGQRDEEAWQALYTCYSPLVLTWVRKMQEGSRVLQREGSDVLVNEAFAKLARSLTPEKMTQFYSLPGFLYYLKQCVHSVAYDLVRQQQAWRWWERSSTTLEEVEDQLVDPKEATHIDAVLEFMDLWSLLLEELHTDQERVVLVLSCIYEMAPADISFSWSHLFPTPEHVARVKRRVIDRLRRSQSLRKKLVAHAFLDDEGLTAGCEISCKR